VTSTRRPILSWNQTLFESNSVASEPAPEIVGFLTVAVTDSGPGLSKEQQKLLFREGVQFNPNELQAGQGSGLGLWITREIVCLHNGTIAARSEGLGKGSTFLLTLPVVLHEPPVVVDSPVPKPASPRASNGDESPQAGNRSASAVSSFESRERHVLVADDAASNRKLVCRLLRSKGFICHEAENGSECVQMIMAADYSYEFIVLDYEMPVLDGPSAARQLRENRSDVLIIGVTGNVLPEDQEFFLRQGANAVLPKPLDITRLLEEVHHATRPPV
jgi:CheY-like chemotaxis protein